jgi:hypothetical protein
MAKQKSSNGKRIITWIVIIAVFYVLTSAQVSTEIVEVEKRVEQPYTESESYVVEKLVKTTKYRTEKVPYGTPRCEQMNYNFSRTYAYSEEIVGNKKNATCTFTVKNEEDIAGTFTFYVQFLKNGKINDGPEKTVSLEAFESRPLRWSLIVEPLDTVSCLLQISNPPHRMKCFYLEPITYQIKEVPYTVEELKNITEYRTLTKTRTTLVKENVTQNVYTNRFFGYGQFFYFGY